MSSDERVLRGITAGFTPPAADEGEAEGVPCLGIGKASTKSQEAQRAWLPCGKQGRYGRPARPKRLIGRGWPKLGTAWSTV